jgi:hypothetical protein
LSTEDALKVSKNLEDLFNQINSDKNNRNVSKDTYSTLIALDPSIADKFALTSEGYYYLGESMNDLTEAVLNNTSALLGEDKDTVDTMVTNLTAAGNIFKTTNENVAKGEAYTNAHSAYVEAGAKLDEAEDKLDKAGAIWDLPEF